MRKDHLDKNLLKKKKIIYKIAVNDLFKKQSLSYVLCKMIYLRNNH